MDQIGVGTKLVIFDHCRAGQPDEYMIAEDEAGNFWRIQPEWIIHAPRPENCP